MTEHEYQQDLDARERAWEQREARDIQPAFHDDVDALHGQQVRDTWVGVMFTATIVVIVVYCWGWWF